VPPILTGIAEAPSSSTSGHRRAAVSTRAWTVYLHRLSFSSCPRSSVPVWPWCSCSLCFPQRTSRSAGAATIAGAEALPSSRKCGLVWGTHRDRSRGLRPRRRWNPTITAGESSVGPVLGLLAVWACSAREKERGASWAASFSGRSSKEEKRSPLFLFFFWKTY
jgi:hypothetical protein